MCLLSRRVLVLLVGTGRSVFPKVVWFVVGPGRLLLFKSSKNDPDANKTSCELRQ